MTRNMILLNKAIYILVKLVAWDTSRKLLAFIFMLHKVINWSCCTFHVTRYNTRPSTSYVVTRGNAITHEWLWLLTLNYFFYVKKTSSYLMERRWLGSGARLYLKPCTKRHLMSLSSLPSSLSSPALLTSSLSSHFQ
jgi:hypothetical protein